MPSSRSKASKTLSARSRRQHGQATANQTMNEIVRSQIWAAITSTKVKSRYEMVKSVFSNAQNHGQHPNSHQEGNKSCLKLTIPETDAVKGRISKAPRIFSGPWSNASLAPHPVQSHCTSCPGTERLGSRAAKPAAE